jgi:hypothetical protein
MCHDALYVEQAILHVDCVEPKCLTAASARATHLPDQAAPAAASLLSHLVQNCSQLGNAQDAACKERKVE